MFWNIWGVHKIIFGETSKGYSVEGGIYKNYHKTRVAAVKMSSIGDGFSILNDFNSEIPGKKNNIIHGCK